ncbi:MAG: NmrA family NAD(P)-binding protein, partial [Ignavibacteriaceae bacterium]
NRMPTLMGKYKVPHFDAKGEADKFFVESGLPVTLLVASFYWDNFIFFGAGPKRDNNGKLALTLPMGDKKLAGIAAEDIGKSAYGIFKGGSKYYGKTIGIAGEHLTIPRMAEKLTQAFGEEVYYNSVSPEVYRGFGFPGSDDLGNMFQFYADFEKEGLQLRDLNVTRSLNPELQNFDTWLEKNKSRIPLD